MTSVYCIQLCRWSWQPRQWCTGRESEIYVLVWTSGTRQLTRQTTGDMEVVHMCFTVACLLFTYSAAVGEVVLYYLSPNVLDLTDFPDALFCYLLFLGSQRVTRSTEQLTNTKPGWETWSRFECAHCQYGTDTTLNPWDPQVMSLSDLCKCSCPEVRHTTRYRLVTGIYLTASSSTLHPWVFQKAILQASKFAN